ncbi:hypothetical protein MP228_008201 [Amoeboaphelidium protococcarum]|nr:hypothetical protein MP228_008201 [Amoeboaphelidium protococcarum]
MTGSVKNLSESSLKQQQLNRLQWITLLSLIFGYCAYYFNRTQLTVTLPLLIKSMPSIAQNGKALFGIILSIGYFTFAIGKLFHGVMIDNFGGSFVFKYGLVLSIFFNFAFACAGNLIPSNNDQSDDVIKQQSVVVLRLMTVCWAMGRFFQAAGYGSMIDVLSNWYPLQFHGRVFGYASLSYNLGDVVIRVMLGSVMTYLTDSTEVTDSQQALTLWQDIFDISVVLSSIFGAASLWYLRDSPSDYGLSADFNSTPATTTTSRQKPKQSSGGGGILQKIMKYSRNGKFVMLVVMCVCLTLLREIFLTWTSVYFADQFKLQESQAAILSMVFPLFGTVSALIGGIVVDYGQTLSQKSRILLQMNVAVLLSLVIVALSHSSANVGFMAILLSLAAFCLVAPFSLVTGVFCMLINDSSANNNTDSQAGGNSHGSGFVVGFVNAVGNLGAIFAGHQIGLVADTYGWQSVWNICVVIAAVSSVAAFLYHGIDLRESNIAFKPLDVLKASSLHTDLQSKDI